MRGAKSNALFLRRANWNLICPCVALGDSGEVGECRSLRQRRRQSLRVPEFRATTEIFSKGQSIVTLYQFELPQQRR